MSDSQETVNNYKTQRNQEIYCSVVELKCKAVNRSNKESEICTFNTLTVIPCNVFFNDHKSYQKKCVLPLGSGLISTEATESPRSVPRLLVRRTGGAGGLSSSLDILAPYYPFYKYTSKNFSTLLRSQAHICLY